MEMGGRLIGQIGTDAMINLKVVCHREGCIPAGIWKYPGLCLLLLLFPLIVAFVDPVRETMTGDDGWAYALTVRHLLTTGEYRLHDWAAANMPMQTYWGALLADVFGYSFTVLRFATLILALVGLISLYFLLRDFGTNDFEASLLTIVVLSSPLVLFLSFTFQTDVQFLGWVVLALWLYTRALRHKSYPLMALASVSAFAAIGTRQFGAALVAALAGNWLLCEQQRFRKAPLYLAGIVIPLLITLWQISYGVNQPTFSQKVRLIEQSEFVRDSKDFLLQLVWRPTAILQYLALFLLPLAPVLLTIVCKRSTQSDLGTHRLASANRHGQRRLWLLIAMGVYVTAGLCYEYFIYLPKYLMPYLPWLLPNIEFFPYGFKMRLALTLVTYGFAVVLGWLIVQRYGERQSWRVMTPEESFVILTGMATLGLQLLYVQFWDVYLIQFIPFAVFAVAQMSHVWPWWCQASTAVLALIMLCFSSLWTRGHLSQAEASWQAAKIAQAAGAAPESIGGNMSWSTYNGAFDEWVTQVGGQGAAGKYNRLNPMHDEFFEFLLKRYDRSRYLISSSMPMPTDKSSHLLTSVEYKDRWLHNRNMSLLKRDSVK